MFDQSAAVKKMLHMGVAPKPETPILDTTGKAPTCVMCHRIMPFEDVKFYDTGICVVVDYLCKECRPNFDNQCMVACIKCQVVLARLPPQLCPGGFRFVAGRCYHVKRCPTCDKEIVVSSIVEKVRYEEAQGRAKLISIPKQ